jgi:hypothetical protein
MSFSNGNGPQDPCSGAPGPYAVSPLTGEPLNQVPDGLWPIWRGTL